MGEKPTLRGNEKLECTSLVRGNSGPVCKDPFTHLLGEEPQACKYSSAMWVSGLLSKDQAGTAAQRGGPKRKNPIQRDRPRS